MEVSVTMRDRRSLTLSNSVATLGDSTSTEEHGPNLNEKDSSYHTDNLRAYALKENGSKRYHRPRLQLAVQIFISLCGIVAIWRTILNHTFNPVDTYFSAGEDLYATEDSAFGDVPSILAFSDSHSNFRWTVRIPHNYSFPFQGSHAQEICERGDSLREDFARQSRLSKIRSRRPTYYTPDDTFIDVGEAEQQGLLPSSNHEGADLVCESSLTVVLDENDQSLGQSLLLLWLSYGLAGKEGRSFFIDDTRWVYGRYTSYFGTPPTPRCSRPPSSQILPCPHNAKHLMVSSSTSNWMFGALFNEEFIQPRKHGIEKSRHIFDLLRRGYHDLFHLTGELALYADSRIARFKDESEIVVGVHIRRGNLHPYEAQFRQDYIPPERYGVAAHNLMGSMLEHALNDTNNVVTATKITDGRLLLATDDPEMFDSAELLQSASPLAIQKAQERFQLATKLTPDLTASGEPFRDPDSVFIKYVDEPHGFEGGFYPCSEAAQQMRELVARAYFLDLAVLGSSDGIVCGIASSTCRILGVMLGWKGLEDGYFLNIDDGRAWSWDGQR